jgi:hypothetical protein
MLLTLSFTSEGIPQTGLTPSISGYRLDTDALVFNGLMSHISQGMYKYDFSTYDDSLDYTFIADGGATLSDIDRWQYGSNDIGQVTNQNDAISADQTIQYTNLYNQANSISASHTSELAIIAGLVQRNQRITNCVYGSSGELETATLSIYGSKSNAETQTSPIKTFSLSATYNGSGEMTDYLVVQN